MAARRYGARYSPDGAPPGTPAPAATPTGGFRNRRARAVSIRARLLYLLPAPLLFAAIGAIGRGNPVEMLGELGGFAGLMLAAWLTNEGLRAEAAFAARTVAKPPIIPRKLFAAVLTGASVAAASIVNLGAGDGAFGPLVFGAVAAAAHLVAFGLDPMRAKGIAADAPVTERVARAVDEAEAVLRATAAAAARIGDRRLEARIERICDQAREVLRAIERDPRDLSRARRFLSVYIVGLRDATEKFADIWSRGRDPEARGAYEALLGDLETSFASHRTELLEDNRGDLEIEIEVLRERLQQDGLTAR